MTRADRVNRADMQNRANGVKRTGKDLKGTPRLRRYVVQIPAFMGFLLLTILLCSSQTDTTRTFSAHPLSVQTVPAQPFSTLSYPTESFSPWSNPVETAPPPQDSPSSSLKSSDALIQCSFLDAKGFSWMLKQTDTTPVPFWRTDFPLAEKQAEPLPDGGTRRTCAAPSRRCEPHDGPHPVGSGGAVCREPA